MDAEEAAGFATGLEVNIKLLDSDGRGLLLLAVEGYMDGSEESLASLRQHGTLKPLGGYANPWREGDSS